MGSQCFSCCQLEIKLLPNSSVPYKELIDTQLGMGATICDLHCSSILLGGESATVISWITDASFTNYRPLPFLQDILGCKESLVDFTMRHIYRQANQVADYMPSRALQGGFYMAFSKFCGCSPHPIVTSRWLWYSVYPKLVFIVRAVISRNLAYVPRLFRRVYGLKFLLFFLLLSAAYWDHSVPESSCLCVSSNRSLYWISWILWCLLPCFFSNRQAG